MAARAAKAFRALVACANGSEDIELACITDTLRRAQFDVSLAACAGGSSSHSGSSGGKTVTLARGLHVTADVTIAEAAAAARSHPFDVIVLPGGMPGAEHLRDCAELTSLLKEQKAAGRLYAAVCASPGVVFAAHDLLHGVGKATAYPAHQSKLGACAVADARVVVSANCITSQGPGTSIEFALQIVASLAGRDAAVAVGKPMLVPQAVLDALQ